LSYRRTTCTIPQLARGAKLLSGQFAPPPAFGVE